MPRYFVSGDHRTLPSMGVLGVSQDCRDTMLGDYRALPSMGVIDVSQDCLGLPGYFVSGDYRALLSMGVSWDCRDTMYLGTIGHCCPWE